MTLSNIPSTNQPEVSAQKWSKEEDCNPPWILPVARTCKSRHHETLFRDESKPANTEVPKSSEISPQKIKRKQAPGWWNKTDKHQSQVDLFQKSCYSNYWSPKTFLKLNLNKCGTTWPLRKWFWDLFFTILAQSARFYTCWAFICCF